MKGEGLVEVTQNEKYSSFWTAEDGRMFEMNSFGSFKEINQSFERFQDNGESLNRMHSDFASKVKAEADRALGLFDASELNDDCNFKVCD